MNKLRIIDPRALIDAIEISTEGNFVSVYINSTEPGLPGSVQRNFIKTFEDILDNPNYHNPELFHKGDHPRGSDWRTWEHKYACHFHIVGDVYKTLTILLERADFSSTLREKINETLHLFRNTRHSGPGWASGQ